jgi:AraC family transcriptional regulator
MNTLQANPHARAEYFARVHRVMDHIETHLGERLTLEELAAVANFSPFHFHRVFTACAGESLYQFILRLRLERAACKVAQQAHASLTSIALDCGFGSSAAFSRAFRAEFGLSATEWRRQLRKNRQTVGKDRQDPGSGGPYTPQGRPETDCSGALPRRRPMNTGKTATKAAGSVRIETMKPTTVAYVRHTGPYAGDAALFGRLFGRVCQWAGPRGLMGPATKFLTIYHDNPDITDEDKLRISVCMTVPEGTTAEGEIGVMVMEGGQYAVASFEVDPSEFGAAWNWFMGVWFPSSGYQPDDRHCFELALNDPKTHPQHKHIVELWEPVRPA